ncbi:hypothetical protein K501DRAFT_331678 [Backusella circina FSU 941]|nr:hypothetical protein K501DRAFT_331678 [Backusella circina FSU 941]
MYTKAMAWFNLSAKNNYGDAQIKIGTMYQNGFGVAVDYQRAIQWHVKAASLGYAVAFSHIGFMFEKGLGVSMDKQRALELYYKFRRYTSGLTRLEHQGYSLSETQKVKSNQELLNQVKVAIIKDRFELSSNNSNMEEDEWKQIKQRMEDDIKLSKQSTTSIDQALKSTNERITHLENASKHNDMMTRLDQLNQEQLANTLDLEIKQRKEDNQIIKALKKENQDIKQRLTVLERFIQKLDPEALDDAKLGCSDNNDFYYDSEEEEE